MPPRQKRKKASQTKTCEVIREEMSHFVRDFSDIAKEIATTGHGVDLALAVLQSHSGDEYRRLRCLGSGSFRSHCSTVFEQEKRAEKIG